MESTKSKQVWLIKSILVVLVFSLSPILLLPKQNCSRLLAKHLGASPVVMTLEVFNTSCTIQRPTQKRFSYKISHSYYQMKCLLVCPRPTRAHATTAVLLSYLAHV